eukprot:12901599-Prorocentrum_lima.AAC.1
MMKGRRRKKGGLCHRNCRLHSNGMTSSRRRRRQLSKHWKQQRPRCKKAEGHLANMEQGLQEANKALLLLKAKVAADPGEGPGSLPKASEPDAGFLDT